jgi:peroxiredoxin Q/BCP
LTKKENIWHPKPIENYMTLEAGTSGAGFMLINQDGESISLSDHLGNNVIVYFYPATSKLGCTKQVCGFRDNINSLNSANYTVLGISPEKQSKLKKFHENQNLNFDLLSDEDSEVQSVYGAKHMHGKEYMDTIRSTFVVDPFGKISHAFYKVRTTGHVQFLKEQLNL